MTVRQKLGMILEINYFQNWIYQKMFLTKVGVLNWYSSMKFFFGKIRTIFDIKNRLSKYDFGTFRWTGIHRQNFFIFFPLSMLILLQKSYFLGPTVLEIPQPNWYYRTFMIFKTYPIFSERRKVSYFFVIQG